MRGMDWFRLLIGPDNGDATALQLSVRAVLLLLFGIGCIRLAGRRTFSQSSPLDIVVAIVIGSNISRVMTGRAALWPSLAATLVLALLHRLLLMAALRWHWVGRLLKGEPATIIRDGHPDEQAMARHGLSKADLLESLRLKQMERPDQVALATIERSGRISVVPRDKA
jgi:uncharacterized membrane protein YcaP (DUF421 family)